MRSFQILFALVLTLYAQVACSSRSELPIEAVPAISNSIPDTISKADLLFKQRSDIDNLRGAVKALASVRTAEQRNFEVEWKFAKYSFFLARQSPDEKESTAALEKGRDAGMIASRVAPDKPDGYFWYGANLGELSRRNPITIGIQSVTPIQEAMNKVIGIQPDYQNASAYDALAQIEMATSITGGKPEKAVEYLEKALELEKNNTSLRLHLAEAYLTLKKEPEARKQLNLLLQMRPSADYPFEYDQDVASAKKLIETRF